MWELFSQAAWKVVLAGVLLGAGLPAVFAMGVRFSAAGAGGTAGQPGHGAGRRALGALCFAVAAVSVGLGITVIVAAGFGMSVSFEHVYPTLVPKG
jgi:hypothetical protein